MTTAAPARPATPARRWSVAARRPLVWLAGGLALCLCGAGASVTARPSYDGSAPTCYLTAGGALEICRDGSEAEGVYAAPPPCSFVRNVQLFRLPRGAAPGPIQAVFQGESPLPRRRGNEDCPQRRATDPRDGGTLRTGRSPEQLATILPPSEKRFGVALPEEREPRRRAPEPIEARAEGIGPRDPIAIAGRDWAGEEYTYVFLFGQEAANASEQDAKPEPRRRGRRRVAEKTEPAPQPLRRIQIAARTLDFTHFEIRTRAADGDGQAWLPVSDDDRRRSSPAPAPVLDVTGAPIVSACPDLAFETQGLSGSISIVNRTYHYFYTDVLPEDCSQPPDRRRVGLYLRTSADLAADRVWSPARRLGGPLPPKSLVRVARAKGAERWAVSYTCSRPANAPGGPVADICLQYTSDLDPTAIGGLTLYAEPAEAGRSPAYLGLRMGGDGTGRFDRSAHFWMTDAYGNLDVPAGYAGKSGFLTWVDRLAPGAGGADGSKVYGRPVYWATWTARRTANP